MDIQERSFTEWPWESKVMSAALALSKRLDMSGTEIIEHNGEQYEVRLTPKKGDTHE